MSSLVLEIKGACAEPAFRCAIDVAVKESSAFRTAMRAALLGIGLCGLVSACASNPTVIKHPFPKAGALDAIASRPAPDAAKTMESAPLSVSMWQLEGPFPDVLGTDKGVVLVDALHAGVDARLKTRRPNLALTPGMQCFAREYGRFLGTHGIAPQLDLQAFMAGRCGVLATPQVSYVERELAQTLPPLDDATLDQLVGSLPARGQGELGVWLGSGERYHILLTAFAAPQLQLSTVSHSEGTLRLAGTMRTATGWLQSHVTNGALGFRACTATPGSTAQLPAFDVSCSVNPSDANAVVDVLIGAPNALLGERVLSLVVPLSDPLSDTYRAAEFAAEFARSATKGDLVRQLNAVRESMSLPPIVNVVDQSRTAAALLPHYFEAAAARDRKTSELIALGLMAGWRVEGPIRDANFVSFMARRGDRLASTLAELTYFPSTRSTLLDPEASKLAIATMEGADSDTLAGYITTYTIFEDRRYRHYEEAMLDELDRHRAAKNMGPVERVDADKELDPIMTKLSKGRLTPSEGMNRALGAYAEKLGREFRGFTLGTMVIDGWMPTFPADLIDSKKVAVTARLGYYTGSGTNWGQYVIYLIYTKL
tara:strand:- start:6372 stop:8162 length:1791 start_codon:yes stop_codon:yes gene_type:complete